jgi:flagella basal body P-ring formation protein FlgA
MKRRTFSYAVWLALLALSAVGAPLLAQRPPTWTEPVTIELVPQAVIDDSLIALDQVARLSGGSDSVRKRLTKLDIAEFKLGTDHMTVLGDQVRFRLLLAGLDASAFHLQGARRTIVLESDEPATLRKVLRAAEDSLRAHYPGAAGALFTVNRAVTVPPVELRPGEQVRFEARVKGPVPIAGRAVVEVALVVDRKTREVVPVSFEIAEPEQSTANVAKERPGVRTALYTAPVPDGRGVLIKARDNVKIVALIGTARVEALGEAQQDGRAGEVIRVRNVESNRIVFGRVEAGGMVVVDY